MVEHVQVGGERAGGKLYAKYMIPDGQEGKSTRNSGGIRAVPVFYGLPGEDVSVDRLELYHTTRYRCASVLSKLTDEDECAEGGSRCGPHAACHNLPGSFQCACHQGYEAARHGHHCQGTSSSQSHKPGKSTVVLELHFKDVQLVSAFTLQSPRGTLLLLCVMVNTEQQHKQAAWQRLVLEQRDLPLGMQQETDSGAGLEHTDEERYCTELSLFLFCARSESIQLIKTGAVWTVTMKMFTPFPLSFSNEVSLLRESFSPPASVVMQSDTHVFHRGSHLPDLHHMCSRGTEGSAEQRAQPEPSHALLSGKGLGNWAALEGKKINNNKRLPELSSPLQHSQLNAVSSLPLGMEASGIRSCFRPRTTVHQGRGSTFPYSATSSGRQTLTTHTLVAWFAQLQQAMRFSKAYSWLPKASSD
ncbi:Nidogen-2 [Anas platyrhynchos]|uniref:Nidogen-2 n=1 Tax=Anas platyrhynchos TaxID=8839 RepID=R0JCA5_ANAPL|nr:Nidogen-2 [Anas platyrhynchos]